MAKNWLKEYGAKPQKFQEGGPMGGAPVEGGQPAQQGPNLDAMLQEYAQTRDPQLAVAICDMLLHVMAQQGGGGAPQQGAPMARNGAKMGKAPIFKA